MFFFPLHFFVIGEGNGYGIQGLFYRYQISSLGTSFIVLPREIEYVTSGIIDGRSAISILLWTAGACIFSLAFFQYLRTFQEWQKGGCKNISNLVFFTCFLLLASSIAQYGLLFSGSAGVSILVGLPVLAGFALYVRKGT
jgi:hypothetical protein